MADQAADEPFTPRVLRSSTDTSYDMRIVADLELKIDASSLNFTSIIDDVPVIGDWTLGVRRRGEDVSFEILHGALGHGAHGKRVTSDLVVEWQDGASFRPLARSYFTSCTSPELHETLGKPHTGWSASLTPAGVKDAEDKSNGAFKMDEPRKYRVTFSTHGAGLSATSAARDAAGRVQDVGIKASPNDVRLFFPETDGRSAAELWTSESLLSTSSPYFRTLFSSGLAETVPVGQKRSQSGSSGNVAPPQFAFKQFDDSDDETDRHLLGETGFPLEAAARAGANLSYKQVTITQAAYSTYRAVLLWLQTNHIAFSPVSSSFSTGSWQTRIQALEAKHARNPPLPFPVSPKSVYRLAHVLEISRLEQMAIHYFRDECLTLATAPIELFSDLSLDHAEWRSMILEWIMVQWDEVEASEAWTTTMQRITDGEIEGVGPTMVDLLKAIAKRKAVKP